MFITVERNADGIRLIDQRRLPAVETYVNCANPEQVATAIREMVVRGAPAIGITAAFGIAMGASQAAKLGVEEFDRRVDEVVAELSAARPTAVNLAWAAERMAETARGLRAQGKTPAEIADALEAEAQRIHDEDLAACKAIGTFGATLVPGTAGILTHCNAGGLATAGYGTALGVIRGAVEAGKTVRVFADETRPFLQGARLTAWELMRDGIATTLIADVAAASLLRSGEVDLVVVGADRIAANGDAANKIGTYPLALAAREHGIPFYVAAPISTIDLACSDGSKIPIEERDPREVTEVLGTRVAPDGVDVRNPAFDVTPATLITAIVTERGIAQAPYAASLAALVKAAT